MHRGTPLQLLLRDDLICFEASMAFTLLLAWWRKHEHSSHPASKMTTIVSENWYLQTLSICCAAPQCPTAYKEASLVPRAECAAVCDLRCFALTLGWKWLQRRCAGSPHVYI